MRKTTNTFRGLLLSALLLFGCGVSDPPKQPDEVRVQLKWVHQAQFAGFYMAQEKGYYAEENIKVTLLPGGPGISPVEQVLSGKADFGVDSAENILVSRGEGKPAVGIAAVYRRSPVVFVAMADSGIVRPANFIGKTVAIGGEDVGIRDLELQFHAMMKRLGLDVSKVKSVPWSPALGAFLQGEADIAPCYATGNLIKLRQQGQKLNLIWPSDYGIHFYSDTLATTERLILESPDLVTRFLRATLKGWRDAVEDYRQAVTVTLKCAQVPDPELQTAMMEALLPLVHTGEDRIGWMKAEIWQGMYRILLEQNLLAEPFDVDRAYTLRFLDEIYGGKGG
jgi:NitT/TauT family transport system substrate-binding protein